MNSGSSHGPNNDQYGEDAKEFITQFGKGIIGHKPFGFEIFPNSAHGYPWKSLPSI